MLVREERVDVPPKLLANALVIKFYSGKKGPGRRCPSSLDAAPNVLEGILHGGGMFLESQSDKHTTLVPQILDDCCEVKKLGLVKPRNVHSTVSWCGVPRWSLVRFPLNAYLL
ncbi:hypothetical protein E4U41_007360 [Claviceps citrina]|nr:hypothetical protein E4U41_007360 [Claviceps citrina]